MGIETNLAQKPKETKELGQAVVLMKRVRLYAVEAAALQAGTPAFQSVDLTQALEIILSRMPT